MKKHNLDGIIAYMEDGGAVLTSNPLYENQPTIHNIAGPYHGSVRHLGFGFFKGSTPAGDFDFDGGGAMRREATEDGKHLFSWCPLGANAETLAMLNYDRDAVLAELCKVRDSLTE